MFAYLWLHAGTNNAQPNCDLVSFIIQDSMNINKKKECYKVEQNLANGTGWQLLNLFFSLHILLLFYIIQLKLTKSMKFICIYACKYAFVSIWSMENRFPWFLCSCHLLENNRECQEGTCKICKIKYFFSTFAIFFKKNSKKNSRKKNCRYINYVCLFILFYHLTSPFIFPVKSIILKGNHLPHTE